jgi:hypothetical protein
MSWKLGVSDELTSSKGLRADVEMSRAGPTLLFPVNTAENNA